MMQTIRQVFKAYPVTSSFFALSCFFSLITWFGNIYFSLSWLIFDEYLIAKGQVWRIITPIFLHFPVVDIIFAHLAFNLIWLFEFGSRIERGDSSKFLLVLILISATITNFAQSLVSDGIFGGMSGVIYALLGYLFIRTKLSHYAYPITDNIAYFLIGFMLISSLGLFGDNIANMAHIVGFLCGVTVGVIRLKS